MFLRIRRIQLPWLFFVKVDTKRYRNALAKASKANFECLGEILNFPLFGENFKNLKTSHLYKVGNGLNYASIIYFFEKLCLHLIYVS